MVSLSLKVTTTVSSAVSSTLSIDTLPAGSIERTSNLNSFILLPAASATLAISRVKAPALSSNCLPSSTASALSYGSLISTAFLLSTALMEAFFHSSRKIFSLPIERAYLSRSSTEYAPLTAIASLKVTLSVCFLALSA